MKIGFLLKDIGHNQLASDLITSINKTLADKRYPHSFNIFVENIEEPIKSPACSVMNAAEIWSYNGHVVATSLSTATKLLNAIGPTHKYLYVYSPEWFSQNRILQYETNHNIYMNPELKILTRNEDYHKLFTSVFNKKPEFNWLEADVKQLAEAIK